MKNFIKTFFNTLINDTLSFLKKLIELKKGNFVDWLPLLFGPLIILVVYFSYYLNPTPSCWVGNKSLFENYALWLLSIAIIAYICRAYFSKKYIFKILTVFAIVFLCREIHFYGTSTGVYLALVAIAFWVVIKQEEVFKNLEDGKLFQWIVSTFFIYFLSQLFARRAFKFLPLESDLHVAFEELLETGGHILIIITAFSDLFGENKRN